MSRKSLGPSIRIPFLNTIFLTFQQKYYIIYDDKHGPIFHAYFINEEFEIIVKQTPQVSTTIFQQNLLYSQVSHLYKDVSFTNFTVNVFQFFFSFSYIVLGDKISNMKHKISDASFEILKKLARMFPNNPDIINEKLHSIDTYSGQQKINIYKQISTEVHLVEIMLQHNGISKIYLHPSQDGELKFDANNTIHGFAWIAPWSLEAIKNFDYMELDCTFSIVRPYTICIPQIIVNDISLPLGYIVGPQENSVLYQTFYNELILINGHRILILPVLGDQGSGLIKFCNDLNLTEYFCIRHIINKIGANSILGKLASKLLMSQSEEEFKINMIKVIKTATGYYKERKKISEKFLEHCFLAINNDTIVENPNINQVLFDKTVLYKRSVVASSSNHAEGFHRYLKVIAKKKKGFEFNVAELYNVINKRFIKYSTGESAGELASRIKETLLDKQRRSNIKPVTQCNCNTNLHLKNKLGCNVPCIHTVTSESSFRIQFPKLDENNFINDCIFKCIDSPLEGKVSLNVQDEELDDDETNNCSSSFIEEQLKVNHQMMEPYKNVVINEKVDDVLKMICKDALNYGLKLTKIGHLIQFAMIDFIAN